MLEPMYADLEAASGGKGICDKDWMAKGTSFGYEEVGDGVR